MHYINLLLSWKSQLDNQSPQGDVTLSVQFFQASTRGRLHTILHKRSVQ